MKTDSSKGMHGSTFAIIFLIILIAIFAAFVWSVQSARSILPQDDEIVSVEEAARMIEAGEVQRILIQRERDIFLYRPNEPRPRYTQLQLGQNFTTTMESLGVTPEEFPPLTVER
jgi:hypothetical protein